jgi:serine/threonine-protein kinase
VAGGIEVAIIFGTPVAIVGIVSYFRYKTKALAAGLRGDQKMLEKLREERKLLEARVQNLESIVCSVDLELNQRLNRVLAERSRELKLPPVGGAAGAPATDPATGAPSTLATAATVASPLGPGALAMPFKPGDRVAGRYTIERPLGHGGMGAVFLARDEQLGERVALKVVSSLFATDPEAAAERFRREVAAARKVTHPNVIRIHDLVEDGAQLLLSMEFIDGQTLAALLGKSGALKLDEGRAILGQVADGLAAAHAAGVVHRDLKPGNVLVDGQKRVKVIDFGLARASFLAGMTATGLIVGTPEYMSPEQVKGLPCDERSDLYSLGAMAYHVFCGRPPFSGETPIAIGFAHVTEPPRPPRELRPELPEALEAAILRALEKDPSKRFADAAALKAALGA